MAQDYIINDFNETLYSCLMPHDMRFEYRVPNHCIIHVRRGLLVVEKDGVETEVAAGNSVFVKRDCMVKVTKKSLGETPYQGINLVLHRNMLKDYYRGLDVPHLLKEFKAISETATFLPKTVQLDSLLLSLTVYVDSGVNPTAEVLRLKVQEAIAALLQMNPQFYPTLFDFNETWKIDLAEFMESHFTENLTMEEFAAYSGRSLATFKRDFAKISNLPPQKWLIEHRLDKALTLIQNGMQSTDAYIKVGFKNRSHFSVAFKKRFGMSPSNYRTV